MISKRVDTAAVASLPMYDLPEARAHTDALWRLLSGAMRRAGVAGVPDSLSRDRPHQSLWTRADLLFSQTCGYPLTHAYRGVLRPVAALRYAAPGCRGSKYSSAIMVRADSGCRSLDGLRGAVCAVNAPDSQSGYNALRAVVAPLADQGRFFSRVRTTGSHLGSLEAVASGRADVCAVDCVVLGLLERYRPSALSGLRRLGYTPECPGLPLVTRADLDLDQFERLKSAVHQAVADPGGGPIRDALLIAGCEDVELRDYQVILDMESSAAAAGYAKLG